MQQDYEFPLKALILDKNKYFRQVAQQFLLTRGWDVTGVDGSLEAILALTEAPFSCLVMDISCLNDSVEEFLRKVAILRPRMKIVLTADSAGDSDPVFPISGDMQPLRKPVGLSDLLWHMETARAR